MRKPTDEELAAYEVELAEFQRKMMAIEPPRDSPEWGEWSMSYSCDAPNRPGYYRANND